MDKRIFLAITVVGVLVMLLVGSSCTTSTNRRPIITRLEAEAGGVTPTDSLQVMCTASDPDGDQLGYIWSASAGEISGNGDTATWVAPPFEGAYSVAVAVTDGRGGEVTDYVTVTVRANGPPTISSLIAEQERVLSSGISRIACDASDPDGDELNYEWSATGGSITGTGAAVNWVAPAELGIYDITVLITDSQGGEDTESIALSVVTSMPPTVVDLIVTADHKYLKETTGGYQVGKTQEFRIECIASNTSGELVYEWSCTGGEISGEGSLITWTAPHTEGDVAVTVVVTDVADDTVSESIILSVVPCSPCVFG